MDGEKNKPTIGFALLAPTAKEISIRLFLACVCIQNKYSYENQKKLRKNIFILHICTVVHRYEKQRLIKRGNPDHWRGYRFPWHIEFHAVMKKDCEKKFDTTKAALPQTAKKIKTWLEKL